MLTKRQLEDAARCEKRAKCEGCEMPKFDPYRCVSKAAQTALAYRAMLERVCMLLNDHFCGDEHYASIGELAEVEKVLKDALTLLKESEVRKDDKVN